MMMNMIWRVMILAWAASWAPAAYAQSGAGSTAPAPAAVLRPGDAVRVAVWQRDDLSGEFAIMGDGRIAHPILRDTVVAGIPFDQVVHRLSELLRAFHGDVRFVLEPLVRVSVGGEVRQPSLYHLPTDMSIAYAVARAGGPTERGRLDRVQFIRDGAIQIVDLTDPANHLAHTPLRSGDQILVGRRRDILREYVGPLASVASAVAVLLNVVLR
jgi:protein involved in polysaccharide export with SLBB domain